VTAETTGEASPGEASFQLLAEHLPDLIIFAFDADLRMWAATGGGLRARGWTSEDFIGMTVPEIAGATRAEDIRARCEAALAGQRTQLEMAGYDPPDRLWSLHFVPLNGGGPRGGMVLCHDVTEQRRADAERRRLLNRVYEAQEGQDRRLAADLHDGHVQSLAAIGFKLEQARLRLGASSSPEADELLWQVTKDLSAEVTSLRRTIGRLRPLVLVEDGLEAALREEAKSACNRAALASCEVTSELDGRLDPVVETGPVPGRPAGPGQRGRPRRPDPHPARDRVLGHGRDPAGQRRRLCLRPRPCAGAGRHRPLRPDRHAGAGRGPRRPLPGAHHPRRRDGGRGQPATARPDREVGGVNLPRLLVVDDHDMLREALVELLRQAGFEIVGEAADGVDAVALAKQLEPDVVLMDLRMPVLGGLDASRLIKDAHPDIQVVLLTAFESPALQQQAEEAGCFAYLVKGGPPGALRLVLHQAVAARRALLPPGSPAVDA
jgi:DNA-binding NarL/FixJ family response regulator